MLVTGKDKNNAARFAYEIYNDKNSLVERVGGFTTMGECEFAASIGHRHYHAAMMAGEPFHGIFTDNMRSEKILAELGA